MGITGENHGIFDPSRKPTAAVNNGFCFEDDGVELICGEVIAHKSEGLCALCRTNRYFLFS